MKMINFNSITALITKNSTYGYKVIQFILIFLIVPPCFAYQPKKGMISAATGPFLFTSSTKSNSPKGFYDKPKLGWGLVAEGILGEQSGLEIGLFYLDKLYLRHSDDKSEYLLQKVKRMYITTGYRYWWSQYLSTGLNLYSSFSMGDARDLHRGNSLGKDFKTTAEVVTEYGGDASVRFEFEIIKKHSLAIDLRYTHSFSAKDNEQLNQVISGVYYIRELDVK